MLLHVTPPPLVGEDNILDELPEREDEFDELFELLPPPPPPEEDEEEVEQLIIFVVCSGLEGNVGMLLLLTILLLPPVW